MNHPSDYMNNYQDSFSSDSSNPTIPISNYHKKRVTYSHHQAKNINSKKMNKPAKNKKKDKGSNVKVEKKRSVSDYLILGDHYYNSKNVKEITRRFMDEQQKETTMVMKMQRLKRKQQKSISKIQAYIQTFVQTIRIKQIIFKLNKSDKYQIYTMLKSQQKNHNKPVESIQQFFQCAVEKLETITNHIELQYPHKDRIITKWKNFKMHQLSTAKSFLSYEASTEYNCNFLNQLEILQQQTFFPQLKEEVEQLRFSIMNHLKYQQEREIKVEDQGVKWVLSRLLKFILQTQDILADFANRMEAIISLQCQLLDSNLFILFQREIIGTGETTQQISQLSYIHIFNKSVFDLVNQSTPFLLSRCEYENIEDILRCIFSVVSLLQREEQQDNCILLRLGDVLFDIILQEALWDLLQFL